MGAGCVTTYRYSPIGARGPSIVVPFILSFPSPTYTSWSSSIATTSTQSTSSLSAYFLVRLQSPQFSISPSGAPLHSGPVRRAATSHCSFSITPPKTCLVSGTSASYSNPAYHCSCFLENTYRGINACQSFFSFFELRPYSCHDAVLTVLLLSLKSNLSQAYL